MANTRRAAAVGGRIVSGVVGLALAGAAIFAAGTVQLPDLGREAPRTSVTPEGASQLRACAGPLLQLASTDTALAAVQSIGAVNTTLSGRDAAQEPLASPDNTSGDASGLPLRLTAPTDDSSDAAALLAGAQSQFADQENVFGAAAADCAEPSANSWVVAGSTEVGRTSLLVLTNPTAQDAVVDLEFSGEDGPIQAPGSQGIIVQTGQQKVFSLAAFAPNVVMPVVHVTTRGGQVSAVIQQSVVRGLTPTGVDWAGATVAPRTEVTIPGFVVPGDIPATANDDAYDDQAPVIRVFVPGEDDADVALNFIGEGDDQNAPAPLSVTVPHQSAGEINLASLDPGNYTIVLTSTQPLVAAGRSTAVAGDKSDFAWSPASDALGAAASFAVPAGQNPVLHLSNPGSTALDATLDGGGENRSLTVMPGTAVTVPLTENSGYTLTGAVGAFGRVVYSGDRGIAGFSIAPTNPAADTVTVYVR